jgi:hypothetical protein
MRMACSSTTGQFEYFNNLIVIERCHGEAAARAQRDQTLGLQATERFPYRHATGAKSSGQHFLTNFTSGDELPGQDTSPEPLINNLRQRPGLFEDRNGWIHDHDKID